MKDIICCNLSDCSIIFSSLQENYEMLIGTCGFSKLHLAVLRNDVQGAEILLTEGLNVNSQNRCGKTPLLIAVQNKNMEVAELFLASGANVNISDSKGYCPIQAAIDLNDEEMVNLLTAYCMCG